MKLAFTTSVAAACLFAAAAFAQGQDFSQVQIKSTPLGNNTYMLEGQGGNMVIAVGGDGVIQVDAEPAREMARRCAAEEGMLVGISSGATLTAIAQKLPELARDAVVLGFNYDTGERYLSVEGFLPA